MYMVPEAGIEPARGYPRGILSPLRLLYVQLISYVYKYV